MGHADLAGGQLIAASPLGAREGPSGLSIKKPRRSRRRVTEPSCEYTAYTMLLRAPKGDVRLLAEVHCGLFLADVMGEELPQNTEVLLPRAILVPALERARAIHCHAALVITPCFVYLVLDEVLVAWAPDFRMLWSTGIALGGTAALFRATRLTCSTVSENLVDHTVSWLQRVVVLGPRVLTGRAMLLGLLLDQLHDTRMDVYEGLIRL